MATKPKAENKAEKKPEKRSNPRGDAMPTEGYGLAVDGKIKSHHDTAKAAHKAGMEIKRKFPVVQVTVFDGTERTHTPVELPKEAGE
jgi:hypothetical protein